MKLVVGRIVDGISEKSFMVSILLDGTSYTEVEDRLMDLKRDFVKMVGIKYQDMSVEVNRGDVEV